MMCRLRFAWKQCANIIIGGVELITQLASNIAVALCVCVLTGGAAQTQAQSEGISLSANITAATDYRFRGISQTGESAALSGALDLTLDSGIYWGVWGSNVDFGGDLETNWYVGYSNDINASSSFDVGFIYYYYPADNAKPDLDYWEVYGSVSWSDLTLGVAYSNDYYQGAGEFLYPYFEYSKPLTERVRIDVHAGYNYFDKPGFFDDDTEEYVDWSVGLVLDSGVGGEWSLSWVGTDITNDRACYGDAGLCETTLILALSTSF